MLMNLGDCAHGQLHVRLHNSKNACWIAEDWVISSIAEANLLQIWQIAENIQHNKNDYGAALV